MNELNNNIKNYGLLGDTIQKGSAHFIQKLVNVKENNQFTHKAFPSWGYERPSRGIHQVESTNWLYL